MKALRIVFLVASVLFCTSCATKNTNRALAFDHAALHVSDLDQSTSFYERLGLKRIADPFNDSRHAFFSMGRQQQLHLIAGGHKIDGADIDVHLAFRVHSIPELVKNLDALGIRYYNTKHVPRGITTRPDGVQQIYLQDPDGYWLEFNDASP